MNRPTSLAVVFILFQNIYGKILKLCFCCTKSFFVLMLLFGLFSSQTTLAQLAVPFSPRLPGGNIKVKGDIVLIGNTIITGEGLALPYNGGGNNNNRAGAYINVASGGDSSIFSSSTADLAINNSCKNIVYAGLYWASVYPNEVGTNSGQQFEGTPRIEDWNEIKFKLPTDTNFRTLIADNDADLVGEEDDIIFDGYDPVNINNSFKDSPIICYKNVTKLLQDLNEADGTYTVANLRATRGERRGGCAAGWTLVVIYESPQLPSKFISIFDGYAGVQGSTALDIPVSGFQTLPNPLPVNAKIGVAALEGDLGIGGDTFEFTSTLPAGPTTRISDFLNLENNFFNSKITNDGIYMNNRNPNSENALGFDIANVQIPNPSNLVLPNDATAGNLRLTTSGDGYGAFVTSFAVDIIEPNIVLTKIVEDELGSNIGGEVVNLGQQLNYVLGFQNTGNDDATTYTIRDVLPANVDFNFSSDIEPLETGISIVSYDADTREIIFAVEDDLVKEFGGVHTIRFSVRVVQFCNLLNDACSNSISNQAYGTYRSQLNPSFLISDDPSYDINNGCLLAPQATNFLADIESCTYTEEVILCGASTTLTAPGGYDTYQWSTSPTFSPVIGTDQSIEITSTGTYYVKNNALAPCQTTDKQFDVITFGANVTNPVIPYADQVVICPNDGKQLPNIFLCGGIGGKLIQTNLSDTTSMIWEKLDESSCSGVIDQNCANEDSGCAWVEVETGSDYMADTAGQYRLTLNYQGGCFNRFYFNVYTNLLTPNVTSRDIFCTSDGEIVVGGVPSGYEYSIDGTNYQTSNTFTMDAPSLYTIYIKQIGVTPNPCVFTIPDVQVRRRNFSMSTIINQPFCNGDQGNVVIAINDVRAQYYYSISKEGTVVQSIGPINNGGHTFSNLNPGVYTIDVSTEDGCSASEDVEIINPPLLGATSALTTPLTCTDGEITVSPTGGTPPYFYFLNGSTDFETIPTIPVIASGIFDIRVVDSNNCSAQTSITVDQIAEPVFDVSETDILCYGDNSGQIQFNVTNANGYAVEYSIDNGVNYATNPTFSGLVSGTYQAMIRYSLNTTQCISSIREVMVSEPTAAVTASAGVSQLAGCGPSGEGSLRITNPQGGVPPYEFSFDNQSTWTATNEAFLAPGTYTLYVRDSNQCVFPMTDVTIDQEPLEPTIDISDPDFNCDGSANSTVTVTNLGNNAFTYTYLLDGVENPNSADPTVFVDVTNGPHIVSVAYQLQTVPTYSNLLLEDFGSGPDVSSPGINPAFCFERQVNSTSCNGDSRLGNGEYTITNSLKGNIYGGWHNPIDHTSGSAQGRYLSVDAGSVIPSNAVLYRKTIKDIIPNQPIQVRFYGTNLLKTGNTQPDASLTVELQDPSGMALSSESTGGIPKTNGWVEYNRTINPGNNTTLDFVLRLEVSQSNGIDFAVDDIQVFQLPTACVIQRDFPITIDSGNAFAAGILRSTNVTCDGANDGTITIAAQNFDTTSGFQYSLDGTNWITQLTSPHAITGLNDGSYTVQIRYDGIATGCDFSFNESIAAPAPLSVDASATPITCNDGAVVTASASGGTAAYSFELLDSALSLVSNFPTNGILPNVGAGNYIVRVTDTNNCTETITLNLSDPIPPTAAIINKDYCYDTNTNGASFEIDPSGGQAPYEYSVNGSAFDKNPIYENLTPGTYTIIIRDAFGCELALPPETIAPQIAINTTLTKELDCTVASDAVITGVISNGYPDGSSNYEYAVSFNSGTYMDLGSTGTSFTYNAAAPGTYQFQITDGNSCQILSDIVMIRPVVLPTATTNVVNPLCNGDASGSVQILPSSGVGPYAYSFNGSPFTAMSSYPGLTAGAYAFEVRDSKDCIFSGSVTLIDPTALVVSANASSFSCDAANGKQAALVTIDVPTTGTAPYTYSFDGGTNFSSSNTLTLNDDGTDQIIDYSVKDAQDCIAGGTLTVLQLNPPTDLEITATAITCDNTTAVANIISTTNGAGTLEYETIAPSPIIVAKQTSTTLTGLTAGTYLFRVTDANGCYYTESLIIPPVTEIAVTGRVANNVSCNGGNNGAIGFRISRFLTSYSYSFNGEPVVSGQTNPRLLLTSLSAGVQTITVTDDSTGCTFTETVTVSEPTSPLIIESAVATNVYCNEYNSEITITASGGTGSYRYVAVPFGDPVPGSGNNNTGNVITVNTKTGSVLDWGIYVIDENNCLKFIRVAIILDPPPTVTVPALSPDQCNISQGFTFEAIGTGVAPLSYSINGGSSYQTSNIFTVNTSGSYSVTIRDANGCTATSANTVDIFEPLTAGATLTKGLTCAPAPTDASINITVSGGNGPYSYAVSTDGGTTYASIAGSLYATSVAGTYQFRVTDANGCIKETNVVMVSTPVNPDITGVSQTHIISCNGEETAAIDISIDNTQGLAPFDINVYNDTEIRDYGTQTSGLDAGVYTITVTDTNGCTDTDTITIVEPANINVVYHADPVTCIGPGVSQGSVIVDGVTGGTGPYNYFVTSSNGYSNSELNNLGTTSVNFDVVDFGLYQILVVDINGCSFLIQDVLVASPPNDLDIAVTSPPADCSTGGSATVKIGAPLAGSGPYHFAIYTGTGMTYAPGPPWQDETIPGSEETIFSNLIPGATYTFIVYDELTQCYYYELSTLPIPTNSTLVTSPTTSNNITCTGSADGNVSFDIISVYPVTTDVTFEIFDSLSLVTTGITGADTIPANGTLSVTNLGPLPAGNYIVVVTEGVGATNAGCSVATSPVNITESAFLLSVIASVSKNENCNDLGVISAASKDGTAPYEYQLVLATDPAPIATSSGWTSLNTFNVAANNYILYAKDAYNCISQDPVTLSRELEPTFTSISEIDSCFNGTAFNIEIIGGSGITPITYSIGGAYQSSPIFTIATSGSYTITIQDGNGCTNTAPFTYVIEPPLLLDSNLTQDLTCNIDASIDLTTIGGTGTYTLYEVNINGLGYNPIGGSPYVTTTDGTFQFRVTDSENCTAESAEIIVTPNTTPTLTNVHTDVKCNGGADGSIIVTASDGIAPYEYSIDNGGTFQSSNVYFGLAQGIYNVIVRDSKSCVSAAVLVTIDEPTLIDGSGVLTQGLSCDSGNVTQPAVVTIIGSGGTGPYTYSFDGGINYTTTNTYTTYLAETVTASIKDANGCIIAVPIEVAVPTIAPPTDLDFIATPITCSALTSDVTLTTTNGIGTLNYEIIAPASATGNTSGDVNGIYTGLLAETYTFRVTDDNGCFYTESFTVTPVSRITVRGRLANNVSCNGESDGIIGFRVGGFSSTYSYIFDSDPIVIGQTNTLILRSGLSAGVHTLTVTDEVTDCTATFPVTVIEPSDPLSIISTSVTNVHCNMYNSFITVTASGGTPNYNYAAVVSGTPAPAINDYVSNNVLSVDTNSGGNLVWDVYVNDANGCTTIPLTTVNVVLDEAPSVSVPTDAVCTGITSGFEFTAINETVMGAPPFTYSIGNGFQPSPTFTVTAAGDYMVTIKDANNCEATSGIITVHPALDVSPTVTTLPSCTNNDGVITIMGSGGSGNYTYAITAGPITVAAQPSNVFSSLPAGAYTISIEDITTSCTKDVNVTLGAPTPVNFTTTPTEVSCNGGNDGSITVNLPVNNDNPIYNYSLDGGLTTQTSNVFSGLVAGSYMITVTSGRNCTLTQSETVIEPAAITIPIPAVMEYACTASTNATSFATITVNGVTGGSSNYTIYEFIKGGTIVQANADNIYTEADLSGGVYTINVYDDNGCQGTVTAAIQPFIGLDTLDVTVDNAITCTNDENITVSVTSTGGTPTSLDYTVEDIDGAVIGAVYSQNNTSGVFANLPIGDYIISVFNPVTGCSLQTVHYVNEPNTFDITIDNVIDVTCFSDSNGSIDVTFIDRTPTPTDESGPFTYTIIDASGNLVSSGTAANAGPVSIPDFASGTYTIAASLVSSPFCAISKNFTITAPTQALIIAETHTEITCVSGNNDGSISASAIGGWSSDYEFQLELTTGSIVTAFSTLSNFTGLTAGNYTVSVRDSRGCVTSTSVVLSNPLPITANIDAIPALVSCFGDTNSSIELTNITGGQGTNYTYTLNMLLPVVASSGPQNTTTFNGLGAGTYNVLIQDGYGCEFTTADVVIAQPSTIDALLVQTSSETCTAGSTITLSAAGGTGPYEYSDTPAFTNIIGSFVTEATINVLPASSSIIYKYYVRDANGCDSGISNEITIDPLPELMVNIDATNAFINCTGDTSGVILANAQGGLGNYTFTLQDASGTDILPAPVQSSPGLFTDLPAGTYQVLVTSGIDCEEVSAQVSITEPALAIQTSFNTRDVTCAGGEDGSIEIIATGGSGVIKYAISPQLNQFFESSIFEDLAIGTYQVVVQDELGCFVLIDFTIDEPTPVILTIVPNSIVPEVCTGDLDGSFSADISGGTLPYSYSIDDISGPYSQGATTNTQLFFDNLGGGDHVVYVRDGAGCESEWNITLPESVLLDPQVSVEYGCTTNLSTNTVTVSVDSGISNLADVDYSLDGSPFQTSNVFTDVPSGAGHTVTVRHTNGCEKISSNFDIDQIQPLELLIGDGQLNQIVAEVSGGVGPYEYTVNGEDFGDDEKYFIYTSGDYTVNVTDANGCVSSVTSYFEYIDVCISNYFTPNGDGTLDDWGPGCTTQYKDLSVRVFDRYGRQIVLLRVNEKWDGNYNGKTLPSGDYWYVLKLNDPKDDREFIGHFTLYR